MAQTPRTPPRSALRSSDRPAIELPRSISDLVLQEFAAFGDTVAKLTDATILLEYSREHREFYLLIGPSAEEERGANTVAPLPERALPLDVHPAPPPPALPPRGPKVPVHSSFLHIPGVRNDN